MQVFIHVQKKEEQHFSDFWQHYHKEPFKGIGTNMNFVLTALNAKYIHSNPALYSLRAYAGKQSAGLYYEQISLAEYTINQRVEDILADLYKQKPDAIGFSCYIWNWEMIQELMVELHKLFPELPIFLGGPEVSYDCEQILKQYPFLAGIMVGEGEETFYELLKGFVEQGKLVEEIPGVAYPTGFFQPRQTHDMSLLPFLYEDLSPFQNRIIYYESQRGCPYQCSYCLSSIDRSFRLRSVDLVKQELQFFLDQKISQVKFVDRTFNASASHSMEIWKYLIAHDNGITNFHFEIAAELMTEEQMSLLATMRPGLVQLEIGVQSTNPVTLKEIRRFMNQEKLKAVVKKIQEPGNIHLHLDLIAGLPYEDLTSFQKSFSEVYRMEPDQLQLGFLKVLKGSYMQTMAKEYDLMYRSRAPYEVLSTKWLSYEELCMLKRVEEVVELYYNSGQFVHALSEMLSLFEHPFDFYYALALYFEEKGYFLTSPSRQYRYDVLLEFACTQNPLNRDLYVELLTYDLYLRENMKSRPSFASNLEPYKEEIQGLYKAEEKLEPIRPRYAGFDRKQIQKMTHVEVFTYSVWKNQIEILEKPSFVLFDYTQRNPKNKEAFTLIF
jgi:radical SAM superfamily enzyme YgiQ (UPF0313 family)